MITRVDHTMLIVADVPAAIADYRERLGLNCRYGGRHPRGTHNGLVHFPGSLNYLELFGAYDEAKVRAEGNPAFFDWLAQGGGIWRFAVGTDDLDGDHRRLTERQVPHSPPAEHQRLRDDGVTVRWRMFAMLPHEQRVYPFLIQWPPEAERLPDLERAGFFAPPQLPVRRVARITLAVPDVDAVAAEYQRRYELTAGPAFAAPRLGGRARLITTGDGEIALVEPTGNGTAREMLERRGPGPFLLTLEASDLDAARRFLAERGVRVSPIVPRDDGRPCFTIDPADAHGAAFDVVG
ncbi:MAG: VOC family protein [Chloroflexota bacterium]|nr:VOC family protein [Dehalococcoidia bacterium]MDW8255294.1 VOC family protein [Chloroflexota bacterium]